MYHKKNTYHTCISVSSLKKSYSGREILKDVSFSVPSATIYALLGSNGAGKTTTVRILTGQIGADAGEVQIDGNDIARDSDKVRRIISVTGQFSALDEALTGRENLITMGKLRQLEHPCEAAARLLACFELSGQGDLPVSLYSGGMKRKLDIAMSLIGDPKVIFLDEPTTGLDPQSRRSMWDMIRQLKESGVTIFLTTQYLEEAEQLADTAAILNEGRIIAEGTVEELKSRLPRKAVQFQFSDSQTLKNARSAISACKSSVLAKENKLTVYTDGSADTLAFLFHSLYQNQISIQSVSLLTPNLEDAFLTIIEKDEDKIYES